MSRTLWIDAAGWPATFDQTRLPHESATLRLSSSQVCFDAIRAMQVRGAPLIGAVGAYGLALALRDDASDAALAAACDWLASARPTAVNLRWALERVRRRVGGAPVEARAELAWLEAGALCDEDVDCNARIGEYGAERLLALPQAGDDARERTMQVLTHCNAGRIATVDHGTALAPVYRLHEAG
ncbi:MAG: S-methyl-5-thioribose-1-phosphate isomerase, partial [Burkholderiaceae bacterium]